MAFSLPRAAIVLACVTVGFAGLAGRVAYLQTYGREAHVRQADRQQHKQQVLPARRGSVFDRNGLLMAGTVQASVLYADPKFMAEEFQDNWERETKTAAERAERIAKGKKVKEISAEAIEKGKKKFPGRYDLTKNGADNAMDAALTELATIINRDPTEVIHQVRGRPEARFLRIAEKLDDSQVAAINALDLPGLGFTPMPIRDYPMQDLAAHILGATGGDGVGIDGLEARYEKVLKGRDGFLREMKDSQGRAINVAEDDYVPPTHGRHVVLTIDANIQLIAEQELRATIVQHNAKAGEVVVMDPWTGEVLALANWPTFNPAEYRETPPINRLNRALVAPYEPGSTIKPFIVSPSVDNKWVGLTDMFHTGGEHYRTPYGRQITDVHGYDHLSMWDVLVKSSNIGMSMLAEKIGNTKLRSALETWEFGKPTGIELPGESGGVFRPLDKWTHFSTESIAQGYEIMVTPVQLARGMCAIANGGQLLRPTIVKGVVEGRGEIGALVSPTLAAQGANVAKPTVSTETTAEIRRVLADVLVRGTGTRARSDVYTVFGKTGTAHLTEPGKRGYSQEKYTSSFVGGAPFDHPRLVIAFIIHEAEKKGKTYFGGTTAAPGAVMVLQRSLEYLGVEPSEKLAPPPPAITAIAHNFDEKAYTQWPENLHKASANNAMKSSLEGGIIRMPRPTAYGVAPEPEIIAMPVIQSTATPEEEGDVDPEHRPGDGVGDAGTQPSTRPSGPTQPSEPTPVG